MKIKMSVNIRDMELKEAQVFSGDGSGEESYSVTRGSMLVNLCNVSSDDNGVTNMDVEMTFKSSNPPEALSRVVETLNNAISVQLADALEKKGVMSCRHPSDQDKE